MGGSGIDEARVGVGVGVAGDVVYAIGQFPAVILGDGGMLVAKPVDDVGGLRVASELVAVAADEAEHLSEGAPALVQACLGDQTAHQGAMDQLLMKPNPVGDFFAVQGAVKLANLDGALAVHRVKGGEVDFVIASVVMIVIIHVIGDVDMLDVDVVGVVDVSHQSACAAAVGVSFGAARLVGQRIDLRLILCVGLHDAAGNFVQIGFRRVRVGVDDAFVFEEAFDSEVDVDAA